MLFKRSRPEPFATRVRLTLWPRRSWQRSVRYQRLRLARLEANPHSIAMGLAVGVFVATLPIIGLQVLTATAMAWTLRGSIAAAILGTCAANPVTYPGLWLLSYEIGRLILGAVAPADGVPAAALPLELTSSHLLAEHGWRLLKPMLIGAVPLGLVIASICYCLGRCWMVAYRGDRRAA